MIPSGRSSDGVGSDTEVTETGDVGADEIGTLRTSRHVVTDGENYFRKGYPSPDR